MPSPQKLVLKQIPRSELGLVKAVNMQTLLQKRVAIPLQKPNAAMDKTPLPLRTDSMQKIVKDRFDQNLRWLVPTLQCLPVGTLPTPIFTAREDGHNVSGNMVYSANLRVPIKSEMQAHVQQQFTQQKRQNPALKSQHIKLQDFKATLSLPYMSESGQQKSFKVSGQIASDRSYADFALRGDAVSLAYKLMTTEGDAEIHLSASYSVWAKTERISKAGVKKSAHPKGQVISKKFDAAMFKKITAHTKAAAAPVKPRMTAIHTLAKPQIVAKPVMRRAVRPLAGRRKYAGKPLQAPKGAPKPFKGPLVPTRHIAKSDLHQLLHASVQVPVAQHDVETVFFKDKIVIEAKRSIQMSAQTDPQHYVILDPQTKEPVVFGDRPPWTKGYVNIGKTVKKMTRSDIDLAGMTESKVEIYESLIEPGRFIVIPKTYVVSRDKFEGKALFAVNQLTHPEDVELNEVIFDVGLGPDLTQEDRFLIQDALQRYAIQHTPAGHTVPKVYFDLPTDLGEEFKLIWSDPLSQAMQPVMDGEIIFLPLTANSMTSASAMFDQLSFRSRGLYGSLEFSLPDDDIGTISLCVNLCRTSGPSLKLSRESVNGAQVIRVQELAGREHQVQAILGLKANGEINKVPLSLIQSLAPGDQIEFADPHSSDIAIALSTDEQIPMRVEIDPARYDIGDTLQGLIVTTMLMPNMEFEVEGRARPLRDLAIEIRSPYASTSRHPITFDEDTGLFHPVSLTWDMPLHIYLKPENRVCECKLTANFTDGHKLQTEWMTHDYGTNPDFTIKREHFS